MSKVALRVEDLGKQYFIGKKMARATLREKLAQSAMTPFRRIGGILRGRTPGTSEDHELIWVLRDISFEISQGQVVGIIGRNGAGKSTLLKILSRITEPTEGRAEVYGRVRSLLEVGTGFHMELTGRENIYLNGAILGMRKPEIESKFDEIVAFSEIEQFLDTAVKHYSTGMYLRLAFAVAAHLDPEILIIDEVLSVGDMGFQKKCLGKVDEVRRGGRTVLFVSHNMAAVENLCGQGMVLDSGHLVFAGDAKSAIQHYLHSVSGNGNSSYGHVIDLTQGVTRRPEYQERPLLRKLELYTGDEQPLASRLMPMGAAFQARIAFFLEQPTSNFHVALGFENEHGQRVFTAHTMFDPRLRYPERAGDQTLICDIPSLPLVPGEYLLKISLMIGKSTTTADAVEDATRLTVTESDYYGTGKLPWKGAGTFVLKHNWRLL
jgi:lipopolysaccharide transport system ATP-binding protein